MENTQNTTATTVAYKDATPEEQAARRAAQQERYIEMGVQAGLKRENVKVTHGYLKSIKVLKDNLTAKTGAKGKEYLFVLYDESIKSTRAKHTLFFRVWTYAKGYLAYYDKLVAAKQADSAHKLSGTIVHGQNSRGYDELAAVFIDKNKRDANLQAPSEPRVTPKAEVKAPQTDVQVDAKDLPF